MVQIYIYIYIYNHDQFLYITLTPVWPKCTQITHDTLTPVKSAEALEYADCVPNEYPGYNTKPFDSEVAVLKV